MTNDAAMSAAAYNDPINGPPHASIGTIHPAHQGNPQYVNAAAIHAGQVSISGQMAPDQMAIAMQQEHHSAQGNCSSTFHIFMSCLLSPEVRY